MNDVVLLSLFSLTSGSRLSPWCHGQVTKPYRQVTIVQRFHGTLMLLGLQSFGFLSITLHWDHVWTGPGKFLNGRTFYLCNPFNRNRANSVTLVFTRVRTNFCQCQHYKVVVVVFLFRQKRLALVKTCWDTPWNLARRRTLLNNSYSTSQKSLEMLS